MDEKAEGKRAIFRHLQDSQAQGAEAVQVRDLAPDCPHCKDRFPGTTAAQGWNWLVTGGAQRRGHVGWLWAGRAGCEPWLCASPAVGFAHVSESPILLARV